MAYRGHVENGVIVLDEAASFPEGAVVRVELAKPENRPKDRTPLRGTPYRYDNPFEPAVPSEEWDALQ